MKVDVFFFLAGSLNIKLMTNLKIIMKVPFREVSLTGKICQFHLTKEQIYNFSYMERKPAFNKPPFLLIAHCFNGNNQWVMMGKE